MADFSLPVLTSTYSGMVDTLKARDADLVLWLDGTTNTNLPNGAKRWNSTNNNFEKFNGSTWAPLSTKYMINVDYVDGCTVNDSGTSLTDLWTASKITSALLLKVNVSDFTGTNILDKLKLVDGAGSGLDADLIDGMNATSTNTASSVVARDASGDFSANIITVTNVNGMTGLGTNLPLVAGSASAGTSSDVARQDHVHPLQVNISGNAATATNATNAAIAAACSGNSATATWATTANNANKLNGQNWNWHGQDGQPAWLWGGSDGTNMYVYNPSNFVVYRANDLGNHQWDGKLTNGYIRLSTGLIVQWGEIHIQISGHVNWPIGFPNVCVQATVSQGYAGNTSTDSLASVYNLSASGADIQNGQNTGGIMRYIAIGW